ncbi:MAG: NUDIX domain-containing protein [Anaerolineales bacterium]
MDNSFREASYLNPNLPQRAATICYRPGPAGLEFLLIHSQEGGWSFPKGRLEPGETAWQAAQREAFEEAGVTGLIEPQAFTTFLYFKQVPPHLGVEYRVAAFLLLVEHLQPPQEAGRSPTWFSPEAAQAAIRESWQSKYSQDGLAYAQELIRVIQLAVARSRG